jgi:S-disulfanyl-L-cysteine oxidoreductase SoxD
MGYVKRAWVVWIGLAAAGVLQGQTGQSTKDGVYTAEQARRGEAIYRKQCASCHGEALEGQGATPPLTGDDFASNWNGQPLKDLFDKIQTTMPADHPGTLTREQNADLTAFLLSANKFPAGKVALGSDPESLGRIRFETAKP